MKLFVLVAVLAFVTPACSTTSVATPEEAAARSEAVEAGDQDAVDAIDRSIAERAVGGVVGLVDPFIPAPLQPFVPLLATLFFKRVRRTTVKSLKEIGNVAKNAITGDFKEAGSAIGQAVESTLSIVGFKDSRNDTADDLQAWADSVRATNPTLAEDIEAKIAADAV